MLSREERRLALSVPRRALERALGDHPDPDPAAPFAGEPMPPLFDERRGVFVTLLRHPSRSLRGCIGYPRPTLPLRQALPRAAVSAALEDPRFHPVQPEELPRLEIEVSVLTVPTRVDGGRPDDILRAVRVGRDGLIVEGYGASGLLLPQVAPEQGWTEEEFLEGTCEKAGLLPDAWRDPRVSVHRFEAEVLREGSPAAGGAGTTTASAGPLAPRN